MTDDSHPLECLHINQGSADEAANQYAAEYYIHKIERAIGRAEPTFAAHAIGADKADDRSGYQGGFSAGFLSCLMAFQEELK